MRTMTTLSDVRVWAQNLPGLNDADEKVLVAAIRHDGDGMRPTWGRDWSEYLDRIDVAATVLAGAVRMLKPTRPVARDQAKAAHRRAMSIYEVKRSNGRTTEHETYQAALDACREEWGTEIVAEHDGDLQ